MEDGLTPKVARGNQSVSRRGNSMTMCRIVIVTMPTPSEKKRDS